MDRTLTRYQSFWSCDQIDEGDSIWDIARAPPLALAYRHTEKHLDLNSGVFLNGPAVRRLRGREVENRGFLDDNFHYNPFSEEHERQVMRDAMQFSVNVMHWINQAGVLIIHLKQMVPDWGAYVTYSTERRPQAGYVLGFLTVGHVQKSATLRNSLNNVVLNRHHIYQDTLAPSAQVPKPYLPVQHRICKINCTAQQLPGAVVIDKSCDGSS